MSTNTDTALAVELRAAGVTHVHTPVDSEYAAALQGFNLDGVHAPEIVVVPSSIDEVTETVSLAGRYDLPIRVIGKGHGVLAPATGGIVVATDGLAFVEIDADARTARIGAGATWTQVLDAAAPFGLAPLCGSAPHVGVVGYLLGGGIGPVARTFGFAADHVRSISVITAEQGLVRADAHFNQDLFWALRGGKGGFGIVVEVEIDLFPLRSFYGGGLYFTAEDTPAILRAFGEWSLRLPDEMTTSIAMLRLPSLPEIPEPLRGQFVSHLRVAYVGDALDAEVLLAPLRAVATPLIDAVRELPYSEIGSVHGDPVNPMPFTDAGMLLDEFDSQAADAILQIVGPAAEVPIAAVEIRRLGGALSRMPEHPNAVTGRGAAFGLHIVGAPVPELLPVVIPVIIDGVFASLHRWASGSTQINFVGRANGAEGFIQAWPTEVASKLEDIRREHDPAGRFPFGMAPS